MRIVRALGRIVSSVTSLDEGQEYLYRLVKRLS